MDFSNDVISILRRFFLFYLFFGSGSNAENPKFFQIPSKKCLSCVRVNITACKTAVIGYRSMWHVTCTPFLSGQSGLQPLGWPLCFLYCYWLKNGTKWFTYVCGTFVVHPSVKATGILWCLLFTLTQHSCRPPSRSLVQCVCSRASRFYPWKLSIDTFRQHRRDRRWRMENDLSQRHNDTTWCSRANPCIILQGSHTINSFARFQLWP